MTQNCIFAVDDDALMGELMTMEMAPSGYDVRAFSSIGVAMEQMSVAQPALLILDLNMPEMGGLDVLPALRAKGLLDRTVVLVLSGFADPHVRQLALQLGARDYLVKPITGTKLRDTVSRLLSARPASLAEMNPPCAKPETPRDRHVNPVVAELMRDYGRPTVARLLTLLSADLCRLQGEMPADRESISQAAHALKGAAGTLGFVAVEAACGALEQACEGDGPVEALARQAAQACARAQHEIDHHLRAAA